MSFTLKLGFLSYMIWAFMGDQCEKMYSHTDCICLIFKWPYIKKIESLGIPAEQKPGWQISFGFEGDRLNMRKYWAWFLLINGLYKVQKAIWYIVCWFFRCWGWWIKQENRGLICAPFPPDRRPSLWSTVQPPKDLSISLAMMMILNMRVLRSWVKMMTTMTTMTNTIYGHMMVMTILYIMKHCHLCCELYVSAGGGRGGGIFPNLRYAK